MFRVTLPSPILYVSPEQLPRFLANIAETKYQAISGEFLQTTSSHELALDASPVVLLQQHPLTAVMADREKYRELWQQTRDNLEKANAKLERQAAKRERR